MSFTPETLLRHWQTLRSIPRFPHKATAGDICQHLQGEGFEVGKRTVERDLQALSRIFPLILDDRSKPFGWSWSRDAAGFDLPGMTMSECLTVMLAQQHLRAVMPASTLSQMAPYFRQAEQKLDALSGHSSLVDWLDKVKIIPPTQPLLAPQIDEEILSTLQEALLHGRQCAITYQRRVAEAVDEYPVSPLGLVQRGEVLYLVCTIKTYSDLRILAIHRVQVLESAGYPVFFAFPYFHTLVEIQNHRRQLLKRTFWYSPSQINPTGGPIGHHEVKYDTTTHKWTIHSEDSTELPHPISLDEVIKQINYSESQLELIAGAFNSIVLGDNEQTKDRGSEEVDISILSGLSLIGKATA